MSFATRWSRISSPPSPLTPLPSDGRWEPAFDLFEIAFATLITTVPLTNVDMTLELPAGRLENLSLETLLPEVCTSSITLAGAGSGAPSYNVGPVLFCRARR